MHTTRLAMILTLGLSCLLLQAQTKEQKVNVTGR